MAKENKSKEIKTTIKARKGFYMYNKNNHLAIHMKTIQRL
jgi:hypothetical protein